MQRVDLREDFVLLDAPVNTEIVKECKEIIEALTKIELRIAQIQKKTGFCGPAIDAERDVQNAIKHLRRQKR